MGLLDRLRGRGGESESKAESGKSSTDYEGLMNEAKAEAPARLERVLPKTSRIEAVEVSTDEEKRLAGNAAETVKAHAEAGEMLSKSAVELGYDSEKAGILERAQRFVTGEDGKLARHLEEGIKEKSERPDQRAGLLGKHHAAARISRSLAEQMGRAQEQTPDQISKGGTIAGGTREFWAATESTKEFENGKKIERTPEEEALSSLESLAEAITYIRVLTGRVPESSLKGELAHLDAENPHAGIVAQLERAIEAAKGGITEPIDLGMDTAVIVRAIQSKEGYPSYVTETHYGAFVVSTIDKERRDFKTDLQARYPATGSGKAEDPIY